VQVRALVAAVAVIGAAFYLGRQRAKPKAPAVAQTAASEVAATPQGEPSPDTATAPAEPTRNLAEIQERLREGAPGTYILHMLPEQGDTLARWPERRTEALRVWIQADASFPNWDPQFALVAERAFEEWEQAGFPLRFDRVLDSATADIKIVFVQQMPPDEQQVRRIGVARRLRDQDGWLRHGEVIIATHDRAGAPLPATTVHGTARHEVGHILGLGHSPNPTDVMFPESRTPAISAVDRATLHLLYMLPPGPVK
jgi:hypothetical protein